MFIRALSDRISGTSARLRSFRTNAAGTSAVEFAFILPIMVVLYFGCVEVSEAVSVNRKITSASSAAGDLVSQVSSISNSEIEDIFDAAEAIMTPYSAAPMEIIISSVLIDSSGNATIRWSDAQNATRYNVGDPANIPATLAIPDTTLIMTEVNYTYTSVFSDFFAGPIPLGETFYLRPRKVQEIDRVR